MKAFMKWFLLGLLIVVISFAVLTVVNKLLPEGWKLDSTVLLFLAGAVLSLAWTFWPKMRENFAALESNVKILVNLFVLIVLSGLIILFSCIQWFPIPGVTCSVEAAKSLVEMIIWSVVGNQIAYVAAPQPADVKNAKYYRQSTLG